jgi:hypothetical protein
VPASGFEVSFVISIVKVKIKQFHYRPEQALRVQGV